MANINMGEGARLCVIKTNNREFNLLKDYVSDSVWSYSNNHKYIWTLIMPGENVKMVEIALTDALKKITMEKGCQYDFEEVIDISNVSSFISGEASVKESFEMLGSLNVTSFDNEPGRPIVFLNLRADLSKVKLFLPRDSNGNFIDLAEQTLCLQALYFETEVGKIILDPGNLAIIFGKFMRVEKFENSIAYCKMIPYEDKYFFNELSTDIIEAIRYIRAQRRKLNLPTPAKLPEIIKGEKKFIINGKDVQLEAKITSEINHDFKFTLKIL